MITAYAVKDIKEKLQELANNNATGWGLDDGKTNEVGAPIAQALPGLFVVLYRVVSNPKEGSMEINDSLLNRTGFKSNILAVSTRIPGGNSADSNNGGICLGSLIDNGEDHIIKFPSVPFTETKSLITDSNDGGDGYIKANKFAIVKGFTVTVPQKILNDQAQEKYKFVLDTNTDVQVLFEGDIGNEQTIEPDNSFALTNISITFS